MLVYDRSDRPITCVSCGDLYFYRETCLKEGEDQQKSFSNKIIVTQGLPYSFLSRAVA